MLNMRSDLTARALIRNVALRLFADHGPDAVSVRQIAEQAQVSPALVLHHYGSKAGLREAVDAYAAGAFGDLLDLGNSEEFARKALAEGDSGSIAAAFARSFPPDSPLPAYLRRLLLTGDPVGVRLFRQWYEATVVLLRTMTDEGLVRSSPDPTVRAAFLLANDLALILLRHPIEDALGVDPLAPEGLTRWAEEASVVYRDGIWAGDAGSPPAGSPDVGSPDVLDDGEEGSNA